VNPIDQSNLSLTLPSLESASLPPEQYYYYYTGGKKRKEYEVPPVHPQSF